MGAPKQKWTAEEEAALKAGVLKHGAGKWRTILKDPEFSGVLYLRSNVDLKDKWRNMSVMTTGFGSREKSKVALKRVPMHSSPVKQEENTTSVSDVPQSDEEMPDVKNVATSSAPVEISPAPKRSIVRLDNLILEAITNLKESGGSNKTAIGSYIEINPLTQCFAEERQATPFVAVVIKALMGILREDSAGLRCLEVRLVEWLKEGNGGTPWLAKRLIFG
uniref:MYB transcription factor n=1 Tax=Chenopodium quinoa TaxID=63459 RepID=A0A803LFW7_CHEQI